MVRSLDRRPCQEVKLTEHGAGYSLDGDAQPEGALDPFIQQAIDQVSLTSGCCKT